MKAQAIQQLRFIRRHGLRQPSCIRGFGVGILIASKLQRSGHHGGNGLQHRHALQHGSHFLQR